MCWIAENKYTAFFFICSNITLFKTGGSKGQRRIKIVKYDPDMNSGIKWFKYRASNLLSLLLNSLSDQIQVKKPDMSH